VDFRLLNKGTLTNLIGRWEDGKMVVPGKGQKIEKTALTVPFFEYLSINEAIP
jgi:hypothetical protein